MRDFDPTAGEFAGSDAIQVTSRHYDISTIASIGGNLLGASMGADAAENAANIQAGATREANQLSRDQFNQTRADLAPYRGLGNAAANKLAMYLGLGGSSGAGAVPALSYDQARSQLLPKFTTTTPGGMRQVDVSGGADVGNIPVWMQTPDTSTVDEQGLQAAIQQMMASQPQTTADQSSPDFGMLLRNFTGEDLQNEPGYQFGLSEGQKGIDRRAQAGGNYFSGAALKAASRFNSDYAGTKFGDAFNRDAANKTRVFNFLSGPTGMGQNAATMTGNAGQTMAQQVGANTTALGNAQGAAGIAGANAWNQGIQNSINGYQQNQLIDRILGGNRGFGFPSPTRSVSGFGGNSWEE